MKLLSNVNKYLPRSIGLFCFLFFTTSFITKSDKKIFFNAETTVNVVQENSGLTVSVQTSKNINIRFYMFTVEGLLIKELNIYGPKKISITPLEKGIYIYDFFSNDKRLKNGKIELR